MKAKKKSAAPKKRQKIKSHKRGRWAEFVAVWLLRFKGYAILARNLRLPAGEIDVIARRGAVLVLVEVKWRGSTALAQSAVTHRQWRRINAAAQLYVAARPALHDKVWRFDIVAMARGQKPRHIIDAWRPNG